MTWTNANDVLEQAKIMGLIDSVHGIVTVVLTTNT